MKGELLLELFSEEIPARMQQRAAADLKQLATGKLDGLGLNCTAVKSFVTPRRLALVVEGLPAKQEDRTEERRGPRVDAPEKALAGFLKSVGLGSTDQCEKKSLDKGEFWFATQEIKGKAVVELIPQIVDDIVTELTWPKTMRWGQNNRAWVRPLRSIVCLYDGKVVSGNINLGDDRIPFGDTTYGHRFLKPDAIRVNGFDDYQKKLQQARVVLDQNKRMALIQEKISALAKQKNLQVREDSALLEEVTGLVEWPVPLMGDIEQQFMDLPTEVLTTSMKVHQKYFALEDAKSALAPHFIVVANIEATDGGKALVKGNEKVLKARLSDAKFFFDQDRQRSLEQTGQSLENTVFHAQLGTMADKVIRVAKLARDIAVSVGGDPKLAERAAQLCKADLMTEMVFEFPELQGTMGKYYARNDGEPEEVAQAIEDHYLPLGPNDSLPASYTGRAVALADKIDTLVGFFALGIKPTGSKDPYALRRSALGTIRLAEACIDLKLDDLFARAYDLYDFPKDSSSKDQLVAELQGFFLNRLKVHWREQGLRHDHIAAVFAVSGDTPLAILYQRVKALDAFMNRTDAVGPNLLIAYRRASNIVQIEEKKDNVSYDAPVDAQNFVEEAERHLHQSLTKNLDLINQSLTKLNFEQAMECVAQLRPSIDTFFEVVTVNDDKPVLRDNRLRLLSMIRNTLHQVADFSKIEE